MKFDKLKNPNISEAIANQIIKMIEKGTLRPGDKLPTENELIEMFEVSRTAIREGMQRLKMVNILEVFPGRGTFITKDTNKDLIKLDNLYPIYDKETLMEVLEIRKIIEIGILELLFKRIEEGDLKYINSCIESHEKDLKKGYKFVPRGDIAFHKALALATHNKVLINFFNDNLVSLILTRHLQPGLPQVW